MPQPSTIVVLTDEDGDEFPILLPGQYPDNRAADIEAALQIVHEHAEMQPRGKLTCDRIEYP